MIPYGKQTIELDDIEKVSEALKQAFLTTGPTVDEFEKAFAKYVGAKYAIAVSSGTAGLHIACLAAGLQNGDELITTPITFAASANCALYCQAKPVFADIDAQGLIDPKEIVKKITEKTKVIIPVHYSGLPCNMKEIKKIKEKYDVIVIEDACHALGTNYKGTNIGDCKFSDMAVFSFHPVKPITTLEGGMITTNSKELYKKLALLRNHGITKDEKEFVNENEGPWYHEMQLLGFNYRISDVQCALGINQLGKVDSFIQKRRHIATKYNEAFKNNDSVGVIGIHEVDNNAHHLYVITLKDKETRLALVKHLKKKDIHPQVHFIPVYLHPYYQQLGFKKGICPNAEHFYETSLSLPLFPSLTSQEQEKVISTVNNFFKSKGDLA